MVRETFSQAVVMLYSVLSLIGIGNQQKGNFSLVALISARAIVFYNMLDGISKANENF